MKIFFGLHKTVDDKWEAGEVWIPEQAGIACQLDDGSTVAVIADGRVLRFGPDGRQVGDVSYPVGTITTGAVE